MIPRSARRWLCPGVLLIACSVIGAVAQAQSAGTLAAPASASVNRAAATATSASSAMVNTPIAERLPGARGWLAVSNAQLAVIRGGFDAGNGLVASFGIDRAIYVNGNLVTSTSVYIPDLSRITASQAVALAAATNTLNLVQNGVGNTFNPISLSSGIATTVIQNSLNNQAISSLTTLNVSVNTLNAFRIQNMLNALQTAQLQSLGH